MERRECRLEATGSLPDEASRSAVETAFAGGMTSSFPYAQGLHTEAEVDTDITVRREVRIRAGQCWANEAMKTEGCMAEVVALTQTDVQVLLWDTMGGQPLVEGCHVQAGPVRYGEGHNPSGHYSTPKEFAQDMQTAYLVVTSNDRHLRKQGIAVNDLTVTALRPRRMLAPVEAQVQYAEPWCDDA